MADFDPDAYLAKKRAGAAPVAPAASAVAPSFDPDAYLAKRRDPEYLKRGANLLARGTAAALGPLSLAIPEPFDLAPLEASSKWGVFARGGQHGASLGFADEDVGVRAAAQELKTGGGLTKALARYRAARDAERGADARAEALSKGSFFGGDIAGSLLVPMPGSAASKLSKLGKAVLQGAGIGAASGAGGSEADLTRGEFGQMAADTLLGGVAGGAGGAIGHGLGEYVIGPVAKKGTELGAKALDYVADPVKGFIQKRLDGAIAEETAQQLAKKEKLIRSASGGLGGEAAAGIKTLERLEQAAADETLPAEIRKAAADHLASPEMQALKQRALGNYVEKAPEQLGRIASAEQKLAEARGADVGKATEEALANPLKKHILPRAATLAHRFIPVGLAAAGGIIGGPEGAAVGGGLGAAMALFQGRPGIIIRNMVREPAVRKAFWETAAKTIPNVRAIIPVLEQAASEGEQKFIQTAAVLAEQHPAARDLLHAMAGGFGGKEDERQAQSGGAVLKRALASGR